MDKVKRLQWLSALVFVSVVVLCLCGIPSVLTAPIPSHFGSMGFYLLTYIAQNILFSFILGVFLLPIFLWVRSTYFVFIFSAIPVWLMYLFSYMNAKVYSFWRVHVNSTLLGLYFSKGGGSQVFEVHGTIYVWIVSVFLMIFLLAIAALFLSKKISRFFSFRKNIFSLLIIYFLAQASFVFFCATDDMPFLQYTTKIPYFYGTSWVNGLRALGFSVFPKKSLPIQIQHLLDNDKKLNYPIHPLRYHVPKKRLNVLLIIVDTLRYDMINPVNMPHVYHFAQNSDQFLDNLSGGDCTQPGIFSLMYGLPAFDWSAAKKYGQGSIIIRAFQDNHYNLGIFASAPLLAPPFDKTVFVTMHHEQTMTPGKTPLDRDKKITQEMQDFLNLQAKTHHPFFGFMFYDLVHAYNTLHTDEPFHPIGYLNYFDINNHTPAEPFFNLYRNAAIIDDNMIQTILDTLKQDHLAKNTVVIITSDHGQEYNDEHKNYWEHASGFSRYQVQTPMIIRWPGKKAAVMHYQTTHEDLAPTLLEGVLGVSNPATDYSVGDNFFSTKQMKSVIVGNYAYYALITRGKTVLLHDSGIVSRG